MSDYSELERRAQAVIDAIGTLSRARQEREFNDVCTPQVVLAQLAENKTLNAQVETFQSDANSWQSGYDEGRRMGTKHMYAEVDRLKAELDCPFRLARHSKRLVEQLRAEVAGLKTGYEAYERVNVELKAEAEKLRKEREGKVLCDLELFETLRDSANTEADEHRQCMATYRPLRQASLDSVVKKCDELLAAMGQGEQS